jgi:hypothetical protein
MQPAEEERFYPSQVATIADRVLKEELDGKIDNEMILDWMDDDIDGAFPLKSKSIADKIKAAVRTELNVPRYKIVVQVTIGQKKDQGVRITSRCLWDTHTDNYASINYRNEHIWASAMVFGLYSE